MSRNYGHGRTKLSRTNTAEWKILVVDDNPGDRRLYRLYLEESADQLYEIWEADTAEEALQLCRSIQPDCVLLDYGLPAMSGIEMLQAAAAEHGDLPFAVLMLTGHRHGDIVAESLRHGAQDYLVKDITTRAYLERAVQNAIQKFALERQKKETEQALRESEQRFRNAFASAAIGMGVADLEGRLLEVNQAYADITGYSPKELIGMSFYSITHPDDIEKNMMEQAKIFSGEKSSYVIEKRYRRKSGQIVWVRNSVSAVKDRSGDPIQTISLSEDISARRNLEEQLRQGHKMEAIGRLAAGVAHDFNNLLTVVIGYADLVASKLADQPALQTEMHEIRQAGERGASLVGQLLAFSRQQLLRTEIIELNEVVRGLQKLLRRLIGEDIDLRVQLGRDVGRVKTDRTQIEQVLINLAANARDAMPHGGRLAIETMTVALGADSGGGPDLPPGAYILLIVSDTGVGMNAETLSHIFEPFFTTKGRGQGTGLGLATVYGIVKQSGGTIVARSEKDCGSTFHIYLPVTTEQAEGDVEPTASAVERLTAKVLLVEDDPAVRSFLKGILLEEGFTVLDCAAAKEALVLAKGPPIDLLLTDVVLPDMSGPELVATFLNIAPDTKILYMSGYTDHALFQNSTNLEGATFIQKPFTRTAILERITEILRNS
jgi:two-component system cell cycle sensor histidine kinase/response regulator CckA